MLSTYDVLQKLEHKMKGLNSRFINLTDDYDQLLDCRLNVFRHPDGRWAIAVEKLVFDPGSNAIFLAIYYYGNCISPIETGYNYYEIEVVDPDSLRDTTRGLHLRPDAQSWLVRDRLIYLTHRKEKYAEVGITLGSENDIATVEAARYLVATRRKHFRATNEDLMACLPPDMDKILVLDEWYHQDYLQDYVLCWPDSLVREVFEDMGEEWRLHCCSMEALRSTLNQVVNEEEQACFSPSSYETWPMIAEVIVTGDVTRYAPTLQPNTHWSNWPNTEEEGLSDLFNVNGSRC